MISESKWAEYGATPASFRHDLMVDADGSVKQFGTIVDPWQIPDFAAIDAGLKRCNGRANESAGPMRAYVERPRGHSKTTDLAITVVWALAFATRPIKGYAFAADQDQAALLKNAVDVLLRLNPLLGRILQVQKNSVVNIAKGHPGYGSTLEISTSDVASSYGILPDLVICDELTHWEGDGSLWHSIISSVAKRSSCLLVVISNAGFVESWQWNVREAIREDESWHFSRLEGPQASWLSQKTLDEQRRLLPGKAFDRLWLNLWSSGAGDVVDPELIEAAFDESLGPMSGREHGYLFVAGVDLSKTRDNSAICVLAVPNDGMGGRIRLAHTKVWRPMGQKIDMLEVEKHILDLDKTYGLEFCAFDGYETEHLAQTLEADSGHLARNVRRHYSEEPWMRTIPPTPANIRQQATLVIEGFHDHRFQFFPCDDLRRDLRRLRAEEKSYGIKLTSPRSMDGSGHGDLASAFLVALLLAHEVAGNRPVVLASLYNPGMPVPSADHLQYWEARAAEHEAEQERIRQEFAEYQRDNGFRAALREGRVHGL